MTPAVQKADTQSRIIMAAILAHGGQDAAFLARATGIEARVVARRLQTCGPSAGRPEFRFFRCEGGKWFLTATGEARAKSGNGL